MLLTSDKIGNNKVVGFITRFLYSPYYIAFVAAISACANIFGWELPVWYTYALLVVMCVLFAPDALPIVPLMCCGYVTVSANNNPAGHYGTSIFQSSTAMIQLGCIGAVLVAALVTRLSVDIARRSDTRTRTVPKLWAGFLLLGLSYVCAGVAPARDYGPQWKSALFGLVEIASLTIPYLYFHYTVNWRKVDKTYLSNVFVGLGCAVTAEIIAMYVLAFANLPETGFERALLVTGWGVYNNVGFMIAFCIPFAFNLAVRSKRGWIYFLLGTMFELALVFTQSRGSILCGSVIFVACVIYTVVFSRGANRIVMLSVCGGLVVCGIVVVAVFYGKIAEIFRTLADAGFNDSGRLGIYKEGLQQFVESPLSILTGNGFYACGNYRHGNLPADSFLPARYHNTVVQLLATGGLFAMITYLFHRVQTLQLCLTHRTHEKMFALAAILVLTSTSLLDCHFFNLGPGLAYSTVLIFVEHARQDDVTTAVAQCAPIA